MARTPLEASQATWACDFDSTQKNDVGKWRWISSQPPPLRVGHAQALHHESSSIYIFGGRSGIAMNEQAMNDMWKLDCSAAVETWSKITPDAAGDNPPEARSFHKMLCVGDSLYVFGGCGESGGRQADLHRFDLSTRRWHGLGTSQSLRGRGGATFLPLESGRSLGVVAGFAGEETNDGHAYDISEGKWCHETLTSKLVGLRPRSVCISGSFPSLGVSVVFGGEVDPSSKGHEGAGGFENDIVCLEETTGKYIGSTSSQGAGNEEWPAPRGWSDGSCVDNGDGHGTLYLFGGLSGDDHNPRRLDDLWKLDISKG